MLRSDLPVPLPLFLTVDYDDADGIDMDQATGDMGTFIVPWKCCVHRAQLHVTEDCAGTGTTPIVKFDKRPTLGSDTSRGDGDIATFNLSTTAAGKVMYDEAAQDTILYPGDEVVIELTQAATGTGKAGHVKPCLLVKHVPETEANLTDTVATS